MDTTTINDPATAQLKQVIQQVIKSWEGQNKTVDTFFSRYEEAYYLSEVAPGRNRAIYLLGHLIATNDGLLPVLGIGERLYPQLEDIFITHPDNPANQTPSIEELKELWKKLNLALSAAFAKMETAEWLERHTRVSEEDFALNPSRNKLNVLMSRVIHQGYHAGQLALLNPRK
jgi:hypothetical protein